MGKSLVIVYCGGRGSGKTVSMTGEGVRALLRGQNVWSNYAIKFKDRVTGNVLSSTLIDMPDLIEMQRRNEIRNGLVLLDEWNLFCNARRSQSLANIIFSGIVQLIRKRKLSFFITAQDFRTLEKNIRWQCDVTVECFDLSFKYKKLKEGSRISQYITDWSGVLTGRVLLDGDDWEQRQRNSLSRIIHGDKVFGSFDTGFEYDVLKVLSTQISWGKRNQFRVGDFDTGEGYGEKGGFDARLLHEYRDALVLEGTKTISTEEVSSSLKDMGFSGDMRGEVGKLLKKLGFNYRYSKKGNFYDIKGGEEDA